MRTFNKLSMVLFDSTNGKFKLSIEANFTKMNPAGGVSPLVYVSNSGTGNLNPNIYLTFAYKSDEFNRGNFLYMSYPQLFRLKDAVETIKNRICGSGVGTDEAGNAFIKPDAAAPVVLDQIGKQNKTLAFKLCILKDDNGSGVISQCPGVSIQISSVPGGYASVLTTEEFLTVYSIIKDLNLPQLQADMSLAYLMQNDDVAQQSQTYQQYQPQNNYSQNYNYNNGYRSNSGQYRSQQGYNQNYSRPQNNYHQQNQQRRSYQPAPMPQQTADFGSAEDNPFPQQKQQNLPPREEKNVMNFKAVEETPVSEVNYNDDAAIDEIFNNIK